MNNKPHRSDDQTTRRRTFSDDDYPANSNSWFADRRSQTDSREVGEESPRMRNRQSDRGLLWPDSPNESLLEDVFTNSTPHQSRRPDSPPLPQLGHDGAGTPSHRRRHGSERASPLFARDEDSRDGFGKESIFSQMKDPLTPTTDRSSNSGSASFVSHAARQNRMPSVAYCDSSENDAISSKLVAYGLPVPECRPSSHLPVIEIAPGVCVRLRGAQETWKCIENDFYTPVVCFDCNADLCCIQDADYVLCPSCRVVSPMEGDYPKRFGDGGVGLGFTMEDLFRWQAEILSNR